MKKSIILVIAIILVLAVVIFFVVNPFKKAKVTDVYDITIIVYDRNNNEIYNQKNKVMEEKLLDALKTAANLSVTTKINDSTEYISGINGHMEEDNYYWNYYVNDEYATVGVSDYKIKNNDVFTFKLEKFE